MRDISKNIRDLRERNNLTQEELAAKLYVTRQTISNYENGKSRPDVDMIMKIAETLNVDANTVFYGMPVPISKRIAHKRTAISSVILVILGITSGILHPLCEKISTQQYDLSPNLLLNLVLDPITWLVFGWWIMQIISLTLQAKPLNKPWLKNARYGVLFVLLSYFLIITPHIVYCIITLIAGHFSSSLQMSFPYIPIYSQASYHITTFIWHHEAICAIPGALLWLLRFPNVAKHFCALTP